MPGFKPLAEVGRSSFPRNLIILAVLIGTVLVGWLAGHILRYSIPALWHPPIRENGPRIKTGIELELKGERIILMPQENLWIRVYIGGNQVEPFERCPGNMYYTSLPAKCRSANGELVRVGGNQREIILVP